MTDAATGALTQAEQTDVLLQGERVCKVFGPARARHQVLFDVDISVPAGARLPATDMSPSWERKSAASRRSSKST